MLKELPDIFTLLDKVQSIARCGLCYTSSPYDRERYEQLLAAAACTYSQLLEAPEGAIRQVFQDEMGQITPKIGGDAAIFNPQGEILLLERADGTGWCLPGGWVEPDEKPVETVVREVREETGMEVTVRGLVGVFTRFPGVQNGPHTVVSVLHLCQVTGGRLRASHEGLALKYWAVEAVPAWHANHAQLAAAARAVQAGGAWQAVSD